MKLKLTLLTAAACGTLLLNGCTVNPYTGEQQASKAVKYGGIAAAVCGALGSRKDREHALKYAAICGVAGAGVGVYMDTQEAKLRQELEGTGVRVQRIGDEIKLVMPGNITFPTNESSIRDDFYPVLGSVAKVLAEYKDTTLAVSGHTDSTGKADYNQNLSQQRAQSVANYLRGQGVAGERLSARGYGSSMPIADNKTEAGRTANRRVELDLVPISK
ncbi:OmpA family protein [Permianibacter sp. IMCC34836]|uniref:OmpA family protein n=1 Tax=Permianibacter fluminis TaxID=2738515 RepID=UPI00155700A6|nr:OmpA family protein [Permianibacter fluminis]NQD38552.1 OmpA family protein [Permianibacter fluminis]